MRNIAQVWGMILLTWLLHGCAGVTFETVPAKADADAKGIRYYQDAAFLFVRPDGKGGMSVELKYMQDTTQIMSARPYAYASSLESKLTFVNGVLTVASVKADETAIVTASVQALSKVFTSAAAAAKDAGTSGQDIVIPAPHLYKITVAGDQITLTGGPALSTDNKPVVIKTTFVKTGE